MRRRTEKERATMDPRSPLLRAADRLTARAAAALCALLVAGPTVAQDCPTPQALAVAGPQPGEAVFYLASDSLEGRLAGSRGEACAAEYVASEFRRIGLDPAGDDGYFQAVPLASAVNPHAPAGAGRNVLGRLEGADPGLRQEVVIVGAHLDHLGLGGFGSLAPDATGEVHNGADDNASGVAALLRVAETMAAAPRPARSVLFVAFSGEEFGLLGSARFVAEPPVPLESARAMLNMDMVGRLEDRPLIVYGTGTAEEWQDLVGAAAAEAGLEVSLQPDGYGPSDHTSFYSRDVPVLHFFTNTHSEYHRPGDDAELIDLEGLERVSGLVATIAARVAEGPEPLRLVRGAGQPPRAASSSGGYGAYLGSIPDFTPVERGVRLSGVRGGSPAEEAGLTAGDVIVGFAGEEVADLYDLTDALRAHAPGETVEIRVLREGAERVLRVTLGTR